MKRIFHGIIVISIIGCTNIKTSDESYVTYFDNDILRNNTRFNNNFEIDSLYSIEKIVHSRIIIDTTEYYIVEGDILLNKNEYLQYKISALLNADTTLDEVKLVGELRDNKVVRWPEDYVIKYCVTRNSFQTNEQYNLVKENMRRAASEWENTCNVKFLYEDRLDNSDILTPSKDLTFIVLGFDSDSKFIASSFFPYYSVNRRRLLIDPVYFETGFDKVGVLRHELGHILGFRHEHIRGDAPLVCQGEDLTGTINITKYDPKSVMHYFCGGMGSIKLEITDIDRKGSQSIYGLPTNN